MLKSISKQKILSSITLLFFSLFLLYPLGFLLWRAFVVGGNISFRYFELLFTTPGTAEVFLNSINLSLLTVILASAIALPIALFSARRTFAFRAALPLLIMAPLVLPPFVGALGIRRMLARFGPLNLALLDAGLISSPVDFLGKAGLLGVAITEALHLFPMIYLNFSASLSRLDQSLEHAAEISGATPWKRFWRITLPLVFPGYFAESEHNTGDGQRKNRAALEKSPLHSFASGQDKSSRGAKYCASKSTGYA